MAITVTHKFVSAIPDSGDTTIVQPSNWNDTHELVGLGTMAEQNANNVAITGGTMSGVSVSGYVPTTTTITAGTGLTGGGDLSANRTIALANTAVTTGTYGNAARTITQTVDQQGRITNIFDQPIAIAYTAVSGLGTAATKDAGVANGVATLDGSGTVPISQLPAAVLGALSYQGTWNASTNNPTLTSSVGTKGYYYVVDVAGSTNLNGITDWLVGDWAVFNGSVWQKIDNTDAVTSVNGFTGTVVLTTTNISEGTNLYYTDARARGAVSAGTGISYNSTTGVITNSAPDQTVVLTAGTGISTSGTYPNFTITNTAPSLGGDVVGPASATDNAIARFDTTTGKLIQNSVVTVSDTGVIAGAPSISNINFVDFDTSYSTTLTEGQLGWDGNNTLAIGMAGNNVVQHIGEDLYFYCKATSAITKGQVIMFTGAVGASGVPTGAPATGITDGTYIMGIAAESIALNGFGLVQAFGELRNVNTSGYADGDILWYDPAVTGGLTKTKPSAPNVKVQMAAVINGGSSGGGTILIRINAGSTLGGTDSNAQITSPSNGQILTYDGTNAYWKNTALTAGTAVSVSASATGVLTIANTGVISAVAGTGISVSGATGAVTITNTAPDQTVAITAGTGISVSGTYPSFTIANSGVTSLTGTASQVTVSASTGGVTLSLPSTINVNTSGNAATVTNGVYTTGSYADPTWITSLAGSKITGTIDGGTF